MTVDVITTTEGLLALEPEWSELWRRAKDATPFQSPHWLLPWWSHFGSSDPFVVALRNNGRLEALAPLYVLRDEDSDESLGMFLGSGISDYLDLLVADNADVQPLVDRIAANDCQLWDLQQLRPSSPLLAVATPEPWNDTVEDQEPCPVLAIDDAGEDLGKLISTHFRKKLRYYRRSLERRGSVALETATAATLDEQLSALFELHAARWKQRGLPGVLADDMTQSFHREVARRMLDAGALRMYAMRMDGRIVAVFYGFAHHDTVYFYLNGQEPELEKLSVGTVMVAHAIEQAIRDGAKTFDFLRGAEEYKYAWGAKDRMNRHRVWAR
jgi:CelD/BcsL family acetyltransferase involved in cellulose biosynthesis